MHSGWHPCLCLHPTTTMIQVYTFPDKHTSTWLVQAVRSYSVDIWYWQPVKVFHFPPLFLHGFSGFDLPQCCGFLIRYKDEIVLEECCADRNIEFLCHLFCSYLLNSNDERFLNPEDSIRGFVRVALEIKSPERN